MTRCLILANRSLGGRRLREFVLQSHLDVPGIEFHIVVPARGVELYELTWASGFGLPGSIGTLIEDGLAPTQARLDLVLDRLRSFGIQITGELGPAPPIAAIEAALRQGPYDRIVISTLPDSFSRWLRMDIPRRAKRRFELPVTTIIHDVDDTDILGSATARLGASERAILRRVTDERPVQVLVVDGDAPAASQTSVALDQTGLCSVHRAASLNEALAYLRGEGRFAGRARPDLLVIDAGQVGSGRSGMSELIAELDRVPVAVLVVDEADSADARQLADYLHAWAFLPLATTGSENTELLEMMLIELVVLEHHMVNAAAPDHVERHDAHAADPG